MTTFADQAIRYYENLAAPTNLPPGIGVMNPYQSSEVQEIVHSFYTRFFSDTSPRVFVLGINPGRFGAGVTGISFTTPRICAGIVGLKTTYAIRRSYRADLFIRSSRPLAERRRFTGNSF